MNMPTFKNQGAQGDLMLQRISALPSGLVRVESENGGHVVAHSESGHDHVITAVKDRDKEDVVEMYRLPEEIYECFLLVKEPTPLVHNKTGPDAHKPLMVPPGIFKVRRQRQNTPSGMARVAD